MARLVIVAVCLLAGLPATLAHSASVNRDLEGIKKKIESEKRVLSQVNKKEGSVIQSLSQVESELERKSKQLKQSTAKLELVVSEMHKKEAEALRMRESLEQRKTYLARRAEALYRWQRSGSPLVLFNGDLSLSSLLKRKYYLQRTVAFDRVMVQSLNDQAAHEERVAEELARKRQDVDDQRRGLARVKEAVQQEAQKKREMLASIREEKESRQRALKDLEQAAVRLQKMIEEISRRSAAKSKEAPAGGGLESMRGKLDWPVKGQVIGGFGKAKHHEFSTEVFRKGLEIEAPVGEEIRVIEKGRVVFADRFSGYGKMLIIDHGDRYYTVYAHLSDFLKKNGDLVVRGEAVALVGDSDSLAGSKLYFEMRKDGKSIDPAPWFRR
ncbi:MAG TPA: peptidoglycan DD-metalloendopeptidase family protein [Candidatus Polarisedimenticolaceae bacterium]|nr:peptidoglycan DD-metalloendopeptidase family protein [Candidatus Polarisedimenticolaceae bacterium]